MKTSKVTDAVLGAVVIGLALSLVGCGGGGDSTSNTDNSQTVTDNSVGIAVPTNGVEIADLGLAVAMDGKDNAVVIDVETGEQVPNWKPVIISVEGDGNYVQVGLRYVPPEPEVTP